MRNTKRAVGRGMGFMNRLTSHSAFTMAEILLSLTIIGVVAAITLPSLTGNINERTWATQKKALYARMSQAFPLMDSINTYDDAESFVAAALNSVTKINNVCGQENVTECGIDGSSMGTLGGGSITVNANTYKWETLGVSVGIKDTAIPGDTDKDIYYNKKKTVTKDDGTTAEEIASDALVAAFETGNGESIVLFYNPSCVSDQEVALDPTKTDGSQKEAWLRYACVNLVYDLNNQKGPNTVGKDIGFMTVFYPTDSIVVSPIPDVKTAGTTSTVASCATDEYRVPNKYEAMSMALNNYFVGQEPTEMTATTPTLSTSTKGANTSTTYVYHVTGKDLEAKADAKGVTRCVKR